MSDAQPLIMKVKYGQRSLLKCLSSNSGCLFESDIFEQHAKILNFYHIDAKYGSFGQKNSHFCELGKNCHFCHENIWNFDPEKSSVFCICHRLRVPKHYLASHPLSKKIYVKNDLYQNTFLKALSKYFCRELQGDKEVPGHLKVSFLPRKTEILAMWW